MIDGAFVIDAVTHGYNVSPENFASGGASKKFAAMAYPLIHEALSPRDPKWRLTREQFERKADPEMLAWCLFGESQTDFGVYHAPAMFGIFKDGGSPIDVGLEVARLAPGRMMMYGSVRPWDVEAAKDEIDRQVTELGVTGLKLYPNDLWEGRLASFRLNDERLAFPIFEHARKRGIRSIAIHKAIVFGPAPLSDYRLDDVEPAALAFRDLNFEIVHGGWAFLEDTALLAQCYPNVWVNLEGGSAFLNVAPLRFAHLIGSMLTAHAEDRVLWATGAMAAHPRPMLERFWDFQIPVELQEGYGYPPLTGEIKRKILGENFARLHGLDLGLLQARVADDTWERRRREEGLAEPWSHAPGAVAST